MARPPPYADIDRPTREVLAISDIKADHSRCQRLGLCRILKNPFQGSRFKNRIRCRMLSTVKWSAFSASEISSQAIGVETDACGSACVEYAATAVAPDLRLPGGRPVFPDLPTRTPDEVLASHGLDRGQRQVLDPAKGRAIVRWKRRSHDRRPRSAMARNRGSERARFRRCDLW
jgi:hypothetical protein